MTRTQRLLKKFGRRPEKERKKKDEEAPKARKPKAKKVEIQEPEDEQEGQAEGGFTSVGKGGKAVDYTPENLFKKLAELLEARGKKVGWGICSVMLSTWDLTTFDLRTLISLAKLKTSNLCCKLLEMLSKRSRFCSL
jgi:hypothetical protein